MSQPFVFPRGQEIAIDLVLGDAGSYTPSTLTVVMQLKPTYDLQPPPTTVASVAEFEVAFNPAVGEAPAYWRGTISAETCARLQPGNYVTDAQILDGTATVQVTTPQIINIVQSVTPPVPTPP